jgi:tellurite resistance protein
LASNGIAKLGGEDFDKALTDLIKKKFKQESGRELEVIDYTSAQAEEDKIALSNKKRIVAGGAEQNIDGITVMISQSEFEEAISSLLAQTSLVCDATLDDAGISKSDISDTILVGGSTRIPSVRRSVERTFGKASVTTENPDEAVALGAALYAAMKSDGEHLSSTQKRAISKISVSEQANKFFGTFIIGDNLGETQLMNSAIIEKGTKIPCSITQSFYTVSEGQTAINCTVTESDNKETDPRWVKVIWEGDLELPPNRPAQQEVQITYSYDENQVMHCLFKDVESGKEMEIMLDKNSTDTHESAIDKIFGGLMELVIFFLLWFFGGAIFKSVTAAGKSVVTGKPFNESFSGFPAFGVRLVKDKISKTDSETDFMAIQMRGKIPVNRHGNLGFLVTMFDATDDGYKPIISYLEFLQEDDYQFYKSYTEFGDFEPGSGFTDWVRVAGFFPKMLQAPRSGKRDLKILLQIVDSENPPVTKYGFLLNKETSIWSKELNYIYDFEEKGYEESAEHREEAQTIAVKIGVAVALADGSLDDSEGHVIREWIKRAISGYSDERKEQLKDIYNKAFKSAYSAHNSGKLSMSDLSSRLNKIGEKKIKFDAIDLAYQVMSADGVADPEELKLIRILGDSLELDLDEVEQIRSSHMINLQDAFSEDDSLQQLLGIGPSWDKDRIKRHLASEFQKWNGRYNSLPEGAERESAQNMLNSIGKARKKYETD